MTDLLFQDNFLLPIYVITDFRLYDTHIVTPEEEFRPDLLVSNTYGDLVYVLPFMKFNNISIFDLRAGVSVRLPITKVIGIEYSR